MSKNSKNHVPMATKLAIAGLAGIGVVTFFGVLMQSSDGKPGGAILFAVAVVAAMAILVALAIKAKAANESIEIWRIVKWVAIAAYCGVALLGAGPFNRFFYVVEQKDELKKQALDEVAAINNMYNTYEHARRRALTDAQEQFQNFIDSKQKDVALLKYVNEKKLSTAQGLTSWRTKADAITALGTDTRLADIRSDIEVWNYTTLPGLALRLEQRDHDAWESVRKKIGDYRAANDLIPVIACANGVYFRNGVAQFELGDEPEPRFAQMLRTASGSTVLGWIVYALLNLMVLLSVVVAPSTNKFDPIRSKDTKGVAL